MIPEYDENGVTIYHGDSVEVMRNMPDNSVDSIVTDPPYGIRFMGKAWDGADIEKQTANRRKYGDGPSPTGGHNSIAANAGQYDLSPSANQAFAEWTRVWSVEALRVLKPGGHMLVFCGPRTYHRMASGVEDAGFEIRDQIMWIYGSGFPKSLDISKAIDKAAGAEREVVGQDKSGKNAMLGGLSGTENGGEFDITAPATPEAQQWDGWGTALKPAHEPIVVARKPIPGTVADNVLRHGTGGININECRIGDGGDKSEHFGAIDKSECNLHGGGIKKRVPADTSKGRFPANIIFDPEAAEILDKQSGVLTSGGLTAEHQINGGFKGVKNCYGNAEQGGTNDYQLNSGGASRFFYCAKASKEDRDEGLEEFEGLKAGVGALRDGERKSKPRANIHPTVKPTALMQYLVRLVTPPGGTILDPFAGSGSTGKAAVREGFKIICIEREAEYIPIIKARINAPAQVELL